MAKVDLESAYRSVRINPDDYNAEKGIFYGQSGFRKRLSLCPHQS